MIVGGKLHDLGSLNAPGAWHSERSDPVWRCDRCFMVLLIVDDPHKNYAETHGRVKREAIWNWFNSVAYTRLSPQGVIIISSTRWHRQDLVGKLINPEPDEEGALPGVKWTVHKFKAVGGKRDPLGRREGPPADVNSNHTGTFGPRFGRRSPPGAA